MAAGGAIGPCKDVGKDAALEIAARFTPHFEPASYRPPLAIRSKRLGVTGPAVEHAALRSRAAAGVDARGGRHYPEQEEVISPVGVWVYGVINLVGESLVSGQLWNGYSWLDEITL